MWFVRIPIFCLESNRNVGFKAILAQDGQFTGKTVHSARLELSLKRFTT